MRSLHFRFIVAFYRQLSIFALVLNDSFIDFFGQTATKDNLFIFTRRGIYSLSLKYII
jgi:hypothetical protein